MSEFVATAIFCEDLREEVAGTFTMVGVMPDNIAIGSTPGLLPKLCFLVRIAIESTVRPTVVQIRSVDPRGDAIQLTTFEPDLIEHSRREATAKDAPYFTLITKAIVAPYPVSGFGRLEIYARVDEREVLAGFLNFVSSDTSEAPPMVRTTQTERKYRSKLA